MSRLGLSSSSSCPRISLITSSLMVNVGITGCDNLRAAELVRILLNHPDVELKWVSGANRKGSRLDHIVPGIADECDLIIETEPHFDEVDVVFTCEPQGLSALVDNDTALPEGLKVIDLSGSHNLDHGVMLPWKYGMSEMQRRVLVHDAQYVTVPGNAATASLLALMPMARNLLLNSPLTLHVAMGDMAFPSDGKTIDGLDVSQWLEAQQKEIELVLGQCQSSFSQPVTLTISPLRERRTLAVAARFKTGVDSEMIRQLYDQYYDDHSFVSIVDRPLVTADVENTNKCLIRIDKDEPSGAVTVHAVMDVLLKGCAGNAVHAMNLMFGFYERAGLALKATGC